MIKSNLAVLFSFSLILSMISPIVLGGFKIEYAKVILSDNTKEDTQNNVGFDYEEDIKTIQRFTFLCGRQIVRKNSLFSTYLASVSVHTTAILSPPPEFLI